MEINERGYWEGVDKSKHLFDDKIAHSVLHLIIQNGHTDVVDIGCGMGEYTKLLNDNGVRCNGFDGNPNTPELTGSTCDVLDFSKPIDHLHPVDVVLCLEVCEHVPKQYESVLLNNITSLANKRIILSWGLPGQAGFGHVNCQSNDYVVDKIEIKGFRYNFKDTIFLRSRAYRSWFKKTILIFDKL